jgi:uncharacterized protein with NRDE domain
MCLILFAYRLHPDYRLVLAANRDEFYERPTLPLDYWPDAPGILAGRDLRAGGTWLGVSRNGRLAAVTNYREPDKTRSDAPSRGHLVDNFLLGELSAAAYLQTVQAEGSRYNGFNLIAADPLELLYYSNRSHRIRRLPAGLYGLSNHLLDTPWPKVESGKQRLQAYLQQTRNPDPEPLLALLNDRSPPPDDQLPNTGVGIEWERILSPLFIQSPAYGTRSSSVILLANDGRLTFVERGFDHFSEPSPFDSTLAFHLDLAASSADP